MSTQKATAQQTVIITIPMDAPDKSDYNRKTRTFWLTTEYAVDLYNELKDALGL